MDTQIDIRLVPTPPPPQRLLDPGSGPDILKAGDKKCKSEQYRSHSWPPGVLHPPAARPPGLRRPVERLCLALAPQSGLPSLQHEGLSPPGGLSGRGLPPGAAGQRAQLARGEMGAGGFLWKPKLPGASLPPAGTQRQLDPVLQPCPAELPLLQANAPRPDCASHPSPRRRLLPWASGHHLPLTLSAQTRPSGPEALPPPGLPVQPEPPWCRISKSLGKSRCDIPE